MKPLKLAQSTLSLFALSLTLQLLSPSMSAAGGFQGSIAFTDDEKASHLQGLPTIIQTAASCIQQDLKSHREFIRKYGISAFYGDRSSFAKLSTADKKAHMERLGIDSSLLSRMQPTSCVGLTRKCLGRGFEAAGQGGLWKRIQDYTFLNGVDGTAMQDGLQKLGWKILYWNPDVSKNTVWDAAEKAAKPENKDKFWGFHEQNWRAAVKRGRYYYNFVDDITTLVNFGSRVPDAIRKVPFWVGTAHMGYHVFPGSYDQIIEAHSTRAITDAKTLETAPFNPIGGGGPTEGEYRTGIIAVPPGFLP